MAMQNVGTGWVMSGAQIINKTEGATITGRELKEKAAASGITLDNNKISDSQTFTMDQANAALMNYTTQMAHDLSAMWNNVNTDNTKIEKQGNGYKITYKDPTDNTVKNITLTGNKEADIATLKTAFSKGQYVSGDKYSTATNPELKDLEAMLGVGKSATNNDVGFVMYALGALYGSNEVANIVGGVFEHAGIKDGASKWGHGTDAKRIYNSYLNQLKGSFNLAAISDKEKELDDVIKQMNVNYAQISTISSQIPSLKEAVKVAVGKLVAAEEAKAQKEAEQAVEEELGKYEKSSSMTKADFEENLKTRLTGITTASQLAIQGIITRLNTMPEMTSLEQKIGEIRPKIVENEELSTQAQTLNKEIGVLKAQKLAKEAEIETNTKKTDPLVFTLASGETVAFFMDRNQDGKLTNTAEYVGAEDTGDLTDPTSEIHGVTGGDGILDYSDMATNQNLMVVVIDKEDNQKVVKAADYFKDGTSFNVNNFTKVGTTDAATGTYNAGNITGTVVTDAGTENVQVDQLFEKKDVMVKNAKFEDGIVSALNSTGVTITTEELDGMIEALKTEIQNQIITPAKDGLGAKVNAEYDETAKAKAAEIEEAHAAAATEPEGSVGSTGSVSSVPEYDDYENDTELKNMLADLEKCNKLSQIDNDGNMIYSSETSDADYWKRRILNRISSKNYSPEDTTKALGDLRKSYLKAMKNYYEGDIILNNTIKESKKNDVKKHLNYLEDKDIKTLSGEKGITYNKPEYDYDEFTIIKTTT